LSDVVLRRTDLGSRGFPGDSCLREVAEIVAGELHWDEVKINREMRETKAVYTTSY
jgi:glycerol-3-phosphate dehydrogenase